MATAKKGAEAPEIDQKIEDVDGIPTLTSKGVTKKAALSAPTFEEWRMERTNGQLSKLKLLRKNIKISQAEADVLNSGAESPGSVNPIMYIKSGENA